MVAEVLADLEQAVMEVQVVVDQILVQADLEIHLLLVLLKDKMVEIQHLVVEVLVQVVVAEQQL